MLPPGTLQDRVAIITGGGTGLGKAMALEFTRLGARVVLASRKQENLDKAAAEIAERGGEVLTVPTDVRDPEQVDRMVQAALDRFGRIDILVNNAAGNFVCPAEELSINGWNAVVNIVLHGTFYCTRAVARRWIAQGRGGNILNIIATYAWTGGPGTVHSAAAKAGVLAMTRTLAVEWAPKGIRVNCIAPGPVDGTGAAPQLWPTEEARQAVIRSVPLGRIGRPEEIAHAAAYLVSDYAGFITGEVLTIDGGQWLGRGVFKGGPRAGSTASESGT
ncbi:short-chain dehydrogenase/reductase SDR [Thermaerobacter marianensis DSM 12885]|uniref:Peroxisomal trans-2-enoyl-CoA reductase n=1 Tax=Thermaerobacter marianensis (strain ATCC 700841 / DSM 12885 / JCM 10246 / 7p75a) TaxID=644966 RepID=E6SHN0_THEM7|nr:2,4-dienoyl-CoA reductase [Thermaerobacter marianensis]ADU51825.1 short-chain dehydrogenase/reductase SDR [Thermaerobacter marianensis DSM 12885]